MSHRVTTSTSITDEKTALKMLSRMGLQGQVKGSKITVTGPGLVSYVPTTIDLTNGQVDGDGDNSTKVYARFAQEYGVASCLINAEAEGAELEGEEVQKDGTVKLKFKRH